MTPPGSGVVPCFIDGAAAHWGTTAIPLIRPSARPTVPPSAA
jgi:hypothetical protein